MPIKDLDICQVENCHFMSRPDSSFCSTHYEQYIREPETGEKFPKNFIDPNESLKRKMCAWIDEVEARLKKIEKKGF